MMDLKLEVVVLPVSDVDKAKRFYETGLACREDADLGGTRTPDRADDTARIGLLHPLRRRRHVGHTGLG